MFILLRVVHVVINVVIVFIAVVITLFAFFVIKAVMKGFRLIFFYYSHHFYRTTPALGLGTTLLLSLNKDSQIEEEARKGYFSSF